MVSLHDAIVCLEAQSLVEGGCSGGILGAQGLDLGLGTLAGILGSLVGLADVGQLVADTVGDDVRVEGVLLSLSDERICGQEGALGCLTTSPAKLEVHGWCALSKVRTSQRSLTAGSSSCSVIVVVGGGTSVVVVGTIVVVSIGSGVGPGIGPGIVVVVGALAFALRAARLLATGTSVRVSVRSVGSTISSSTGCGIRGSARGSTGSGTGGGTTSSSLCAISSDGSQVGEALGSHDVGDRQASGIERSGQRRLGVGVLDIRASDGRVDQRHDTTQLCGGGKGGVRADAGDGDHEGVEVLLRGDESLGSIDHGLVSAELGDDLVGQGEL